MKVTIGLAQTCHPDDGDVIGLVERWALDAKRQGVDLLVFPESLMTRYELALGQFEAEAQPLDGPFARTVDDIARRTGLWMVYTVNEKNPDSLKPYNTAVVVDDEGCVRATYRKVHLFDAGPHRESDRMSAGDTILRPIDTPFGKLGIGICYDLRFPELARRQAIEGAEILVYPAAWVDGAGKKRQWETLLAARAIENQFFLAACNSCGTAGETVFGGASRILGPRGELLAAAGAGEEIVTAALDFSVLAEVRNSINVFHDRRPELYRL